MEQEDRESARNEEKDEDGHGDQVQNGHHVNHIKSLKNNAGTQKVSVDLMVICGYMVTKYEEEKLQIANSAGIKNGDRWQFWRNPSDSKQKRKPIS
jgi:hypothetical protein